MLRRILAMMASDSTLMLEKIEADLFLDRATIDDMLAKLCALGYIEELSAKIEKACREDEEGASHAKCGGCSGCGIADCGGGGIHLSRVWTLTRKGLAYARADSNS